MQNKEIVDAGQEINELFNAIKKNMKQIILLDKMKVTDTDFIENFEKIVDKLAPDGTLLKFIEEFYIKANTAVEKHKELSEMEFKKIEAEYIRELKTKEIQVLECNEGWRVGKLKLRINPTAAKAMFLYNEEDITDWVSINSKEDFINLEQKANKMLKDFEIEEEKLVDIFWQAYRSYLLENKQAEETGMVPIKDFYEEFFIKLNKENIKKEKNKLKINKNYIEYPLWAFLYNLDRYRALGSKVQAEKKLGLQTGSLQETSKNKGLVVNGLNPQEGYKVMCYVVAIRRLK